MNRLKFLFIVATLSWGGAAFAQPSDLRLPRTKDRPGSATPQTRDSLANYANNRREAALAAFQASVKAAMIEHKRDRATRLMLVALRRDPSLDLALYDMGILCAQYARWEDAINFQKEARRRALAGSEVARLAAAELERVEAVARLETSRREYDKSLRAAAMNEDSIKALIAATALTERDAARWEGFALAGILQAEAGDYSASQEKLKAAIKTDQVPAARRSQLQEAVDIAGREVDSIKDLRQADELFNNRGDGKKPEYGAAAEHYDAAWHSSPGRLNIARQAITAYLLADQVDPAVKILCQLHSSGQTDLDKPRNSSETHGDKIAGMLAALGTYSGRAKEEAARPAPATTPPPGDAAARIREQVGILVTPQMELVAKPDPPLVDGTMPVIPVPDDEITSGQSDIGYLSSVSLFAIYQRDAAGGSPATPPLQPATPAPAPPAARAAATPTVHLDVISQPPGASITFDKDDPNAVRTCTAPCQVALPRGRHTLRATLQGYNEATRIVTLERERQTEIVELYAKRGKIWVDSNPAGLAVSLNGKQTGKLTPTDFLLDEGEYDLGVEINGKPVVQKVSIQDGSLNKTHFGQ